NYDKGVVHGNVGQGPSLATQTRACPCGVAMRQCPGSARASRAAPVRLGLAEPRRNALWTESPRWRGAIARTRGACAPRNQLRRSTLNFEVVLTSRSARLRLIAFHRRAGGVF